MNHSFTVCDDAHFPCRSGDHDYIGSCTTSLREITPEKGGEVRTLDIINQDIKKKKKKYTNSGTLNFNTVRYVGSCARVGVCACVCVCVCVNYACMCVCE